MNWFAKSLIAVVLIFAAANSAGAECPIVSPDSTRSFAFYLGDTLANPVARASGDSMWIFVYYPSGGLAFADSVRLLNGANLTYRQTQIQGRLTAHFSYSRLISAIDGTAQNGPYEVVIIASDSSLALQSTFIYCFDERLGGLDSIGIDNSQFWASANAARLKEILDTLQVYDNAGQFQAEIAAILDTLNLYDDATRSWGANALKWNGTAVGTPKNAGYPDVTVKYWGGGAAGDTVASLDSGTYVLPRISMSIPVGTTRDSLFQLANRGSDTTISVANEINANVTNWGGLGPTIALGGSGLPQVDVGSVTSFGTAQLSSTNIGATAAAEIADSVLGAGVGQHSDRDSTIGGAFSRNAGQAFVNINLDTAAGTLANSQVDDDVDVNVKTVTAGAIDSVDFAADAKKMIAIRSDSGIADITTASFAAGAIDDAAVADGAIDWGGEFDTAGVGAAIRKPIGDSLSGAILGISEMQSFMGACDECYYRLFPEGGTANKDSAIVIDGSVNTADSLLGKIIYKHGTVNSVYDTAFFYTRPWW